MSAPIEIETGKPITPKQPNRRGAKPRYPFGLLEVGQSFTVPLEYDRYESSGNDKAYQKLLCAAAVWKRRNGRDFTSRIIREEGVVRCWRVA